MTSTHRAAEKRGRWAEHLCRLRLILSGWQIIDHRRTGLRGTGVGELDLVARRGGVLAVIEVKARSTEQAALESLSLQQRQRILRAAEQLLAQRPEWQSYSVRFDVMTVTPWRWPKHLPDAWRP